MAKSRGGRPSKGQRELLGTRLDVPLADATRQRAEELGMTVSDYIATTLAQDLQMLQFSPHQPTPLSHSGQISKGQRELLGTRVLQTLAEAARQRAAEHGISVSDYLATLIALDIQQPQLAPASLVPFDANRLQR